MERGERKHVAFDNLKDEMIVCTRRQKADLQSRIAKAKITVRGHILGFIVEATR